jgi:hypothetical protein
MSGASISPLLHKQKALGISKATHPMEVAWLEKNGDLVPWDRVKTLDQLKEFVERRVAQRMELEQYALTAEGTIIAEQSEMRALSIKARKGDLEAAKAIELHEKGGWEMVLKGHFNPKRKANHDLWKWYLTEENEEYAQDPFWQDLVWDIPESSWRKKGTFGMGETVELKPGVLAKLRDDIGIENIDLSKEYSRLMRQLDRSSQQDLTIVRESKSWIYIPWEGEDPGNFEANVEKLDNIVPMGMKDKEWKSESYLRDGSFWLLRNNRKIKLAIRLHQKNSKLEWIRDEWGKGKIPDEYFEEVLYLIRIGKLPGAGYAIAAKEKDPKRQIELAKTRKLEVLQSLAANINIDPKAQLILVESKDEEVQWRLARNRSITPEAQLALVKSEYKETRGYLAANPSIIPEVQETLANSNDPNIQECLAGNPCITRETQLILANSNNPSVQRRLTLNENLVPEAQPILAASNHDTVQRILAEIANIVPEAQRILAESKVKSTQRTLAVKENITPEAQLILTKSEDEVTLKLLAENPCITRETQLILANSNDPLVQRHLGLNNNIIREAQLILAQSKNEITQRYIAINRGIVPEAQRILAESEYVRTRECLAGNPSITERARQILNADGVSLQENKAEAAQAEGFENVPAKVPKHEK